jgi:membrane protein DedA with SNARE-associated domain
VNEREPASEPAAKASSEAAPEHRSLDRNDRKAITLFAIPMAILTILGWIGDAFAPSLLTRAPLLLLVCNPRLRNLVLVSPTVDFLPFVAVAIGRLVISDPLFYFFGRRYGDTSIRWMERKLGPSAGVVLWFEKMFRKAAWPVVAILPNNIICLLAGAAGMSWIGFAIVNVSGTIVRVLGVRLIGDAFSDPILDFNAWIGRNRLWLTLITIGITFFFVARSSMRSGKVVETPEDLAEELEASAEELEASTDDLEASAEELDGEERGASAEDRRPEPG